MQCSTQRRNENRSNKNVFTMCFKVFAHCQNILGQLSDSCLVFFVQISLHHQLTTTWKVWGQFRSKFNKQIVCSFGEVFCQSAIDSAQSDHTMVTRLTAKMLEVLNWSRGCSQNLCPRSPRPGPSKNMFGILGADFNRTWCQVVAGIWHRFCKALQQSQKTLIGFNWPVAHSTNKQQFEWNIIYCTSLDWKYRPKHLRHTHKSRVHYPLCSPQHFGIWQPLFHKVQCCRCSRPQINKDSGTIFVHQEGS